jgi:hypothetical protein
VALAGWLPERPPLLATSYVDTTDEQKADILTKPNKLRQTGEAFFIATHAVGELIAIIVGG